MIENPLVSHVPLNGNRCADCFYTSGPFGGYPDLFCDNPLISKYEGQELVAVLPYFSCKHFALEPYSGGPHD